MIEQLKQIGLSPFQAEIYAFLIDYPNTPASRIARQTGIQRSMVYVVLQELQSLELVLRDDSRKVARFKIGDPEILHSILDSKEASIQLARNAHKVIDQQLKQQYAIQSGQPGVRFYGGLKGMENLYKDMNASGVKEIFIIRSNMKPPEEMRKLITKQRELQKERGVIVNIINSTIDDGIEKYLHLDAERGVNRRVIRHEVFSNPAQIIIYGRKVGFTTYAEPTMTVVIEHPDIAQTLLSMFGIIWKHTEKESAQNIDRLLKQ